MISAQPRAGVNGAPALRIDEDGDIRVPRTFEPALAPIVQITTFYGLVGALSLQLGRTAGPQQGHENSLKLCWFVAPDNWPPSSQASLVPMYASPPIRRGLIP